MKTPKQIKVWEKELSKAIKSGEVVFDEPDSTPRELLTDFFYQVKLELERRVKGGGAIERKNR